MKGPPREGAEPLWREEISIYSADERYVSRRQLAKFLVLTSLGMFVGNAWILVRSWFARRPVYPVRPVGTLAELPVGGVKLFRYPGPHDPCILVRHGEDAWAAYSQKCTHLSCAVYYAHDSSRLECPCHEGLFSVKDGRVLAGPPQRPLPRITLERRAGELVATGVELSEEA
ncbi:MAG: arsenite oxidase small subunit [Acidobacteriota bacterium]|jgi:nitrite reductase/ring-hydroxylating ferredoxin subunit|nr:arsenite oxidase small subunit [Acidobacteriota bacterium]